MFHWSGLSETFLCSDLNGVSGRAATTRGLCPRKSKGVRGHAPPENLGLLDAPERNFRILG